MKIYDIDFNLLNENDIDLSKGSLQPTYIIKEDAVPIDNKHKFAWEDSDYEEVQIYQPYAEEETEPKETVESLQEKLTIAMNAIELLQAQVEAQSDQMDFYEDCITEIAEVVYA